jgi:hypothetical protein
MYTNGTASPGATSHFFYYKYGEGGEYQRIKKDASNLRVYFADCPEALKQLDLYNRYRRRSKGANVLQILSAIVLVPGLVTCAAGFVADEDEINVPIVIVGGFAAVGGIVGYCYYNNRTDALIDKAYAALQKAAEIYNKHLIDNKLIVSDGN